LVTGVQTCALPISSFSLVEISFRKLWQNPLLNGVSVKYDYYPINAALTTYQPLGEAGVPVSVMNDRMNDRWNVRIELPSRFSIAAQQVQCIALQQVQW